MKEDTQVRLRDESEKKIFSFIVFQWAGFSEAKLAILKFHHSKYVVLFFFDVGCLLPAREEQRGRVMIACRAGEEDETE
jgi:hypothetical protein